MLEGGVGVCCRCFCGMATTTFTIILLVALFIPSSKPTCSIDSFYVPALNRSANATANNTIFFHLRLLNIDTLRGIYYDPINLTLYYIPIPTIVVVNHTVPSFYQSRKRSTHLRESMEASGLPWEAALQAASNGSVVMFRVRLVTAVRDKFIFKKSKRRKLTVGGAVSVNSVGEDLSGKAVKLKSGTSEMESHCAWVGIFSLLFTTMDFVFDPLNGFNLL